jgi:glutathione synthase/RimK-type ligase-like ATP-grasp enzyme
MKNNFEPTVLERPADGRCLRVVVIAERRYCTHLQPYGMITSLKEAGHSVVVVDPEERAFNAGDHYWLQNIDVGVARGRSWGVLCLLRWLEIQGVLTINSRAAIASVHNKAEMAVALSAAGIPTPRTWLGSPQMVAQQLAGKDFPVIVKPVFGDNCHGLERVSSREQLIALQWPEPLAIVQQFIPGLASDLKLYCIGRRVWAVRKPSPLAGVLFPNLVPHAPQLLPVTAAWRDLALRCGEVFGLQLFGVDCLQTEAGTLVIEVNEFPNYSAVPGADQELSNYLLAFVKQERTV